MKRTEREGLVEVTLIMAKGYFNRYGNGPAHWRWLMAYGVFVSGCDGEFIKGQMEWSGPKK